MQDIAATVGGLVVGLFEEYSAALGDDELATLATASSTYLMLADGVAGRAFDSNDDFTDTSETPDEGEVFRW